MLVHVFLERLTGNTEYLNYVRFYAYLLMAVDKNFGTVLDALQSKTRSVSQHDSHPPGRPRRDGALAWRHDTEAF